MSTSPQEKGLSLEEDQELKKFAVLYRKADERSELIVAVPTVLQSGAIWLIGGLVLVTLAVLFFGRISLVVGARGQIIPEGDLRVIETLESGVVSRIAAQPGDHLRKGDTILVLDLPESNISIEELQRKTEAAQEQLTALETSAAMLDKLLDSPGADTSRMLAVSSSLQAANLYSNARLRMDAANQELAASPERRKLLIAQMELVKESLRNAERMEENFQHALAEQQAGLEEKSRQLKAFRGLAEKKLLSPFELAGEEDKFRAAEETVVSARQRADQETVEIGNLRLKISEIQTQISSEANSKQREFREAASAMQQALSAVRQERASLTSRITELKGEIGIADARLRVATERLRFGSVISPVAGILADLKINGTGSLISAGSPVATVVPESEPLALLVQVANKDIGLVHPGTGAQIKVDAFPFQQYGTIPAEVVRVLPNVTKDNTFPVRLRLLKSGLSNGSSHVNVFPGLNVQADLITSRQRLISLLFASDGAQ